MNEVTEFSNSPDYRTDRIHMIGMDTDGDFYERVEATGFLDHPHKFYVYVRRRLPDKSLQHVKTWKNALPTPDDVGYAFGGGKAIIDLEILFEKNSGKKKKGIRTTILFDKVWNEWKKEHDWKTAFRRKMY